jgi:hypothetical protein
MRKMKVEEEMKEDENKLTRSLVVAFFDPSGTTIVPRRNTDMIAESGTRVSTSQDGKCE